MTISSAIRSAPVVLGDLLDWPATLYPNRPAIQSADSCTTFQQLREASIEKTAMFANFGIGRFHRWGLVPTKSPRFFECLFGLLRLGAVAAPIAHSLTPERLVTVFRQARLSGFVAPLDFVLDETVLSELSLQRFRLGSHITIFAPTDGNKQHSVQVRTIDVDPALILWTSGSTGSPRGVVLQHSAILSNIRSNIAALGLQDDDRTLVVLPIAHAYGLIHQCLCHLAIGGTLCLPDSPLLGPSVCRLLRDWRITTLSAVPPLLGILVEETTRTRSTYPELRLITIGAARVDRGMLEQALALFPGVQLAITYGLTEAGPRVSTHFVQEGQVDPAHVGSPLSNVEICIRKRRDGAQETCVRGRSIMRSYADEAFDEGADYLLHTADRGELRNGDLYVHGRLDRTINRGGELVSAEAIEAILLRYPGIVAARVEAEPHSFWGQVPVARIVFGKGRPLPSLEALHRFCANLLPPSEVPTRFEFCDHVSGRLLEKTRRMLEIPDDCFRSEVAEIYDSAQ